MTPTIGALFRRAFAPVLVSMVLAVCLSGPTPARADYPDHIINGIVPFGPGGPSDIISRIVAEAMSKELGQTIVVQNKAGAGGNLGMGLAAHAKPDGYTLLLCSIATTQNPAVYRNMPYDPMKDLVAISMLGESATMVGVSAKNFPTANFAEFIETVRKNPGKYNIGGAGGQMMTMQKFLLLFGLNMQIINYRSGGEAATALASGEVDLQLNNATTLAAGAQGGRIRLLAVAGNERLKSFPDLPTTKEAGAPQYLDSAYVGLYAPAGTPADVIAKLSDAATKALKSEEVRKRFADLDYVATPGPQQQADEFYHSEVVRWRDVAQKANIPPVD